MYVLDREVKVLNTFEVSVKFSQLTGFISQKILYTLTSIPTVAVGMLLVKFKLEGQINREERQKYKHRLCRSQSFLGS
jgi:hypothetical protein